MERAAPSGGPFVLLFGVSGFDEAALQFFEDRFLGLVDLRDLRHFAGLRSFGACDRGLQCGRYVVRFFGCNWYVWQFCLL